MDPNITIPTNTAKSLGVKVKQIHTDLPKPSGLEKHVVLSPNVRTVTAKNININVQTRKWGNFRYIFKYSKETSVTDDHWSLMISAIKSQHYFKIINLVKVFLEIKEVRSNNFQEVTFSVEDECENQKDKFNALFDRESDADIKMSLALRENARFE